MSGGGGGEMMRWGWAADLSQLLRRAGEDRRPSALERALETAPANAEAAPADSWGLKGDSGLPGVDPAGQVRGDVAAAVLVMSQGQCAVSHKASHTSRLMSLML